MPTKIRLQRRGKKHNAFYHIVITDSRAPRDGKFIENIGTYNPNTNPANIDLKFEKALNWVKTGAVPTETVRAILSYEGVLFKNHLDKGVLKGALTEADANKKFDVWKQDKMNKIQQKIEFVSKSKIESFNKAIKAEVEINKKREESIIAKNSALAEEAKRQSAEAAAASAAPAVEVPVVEAAVIEAEANIVEEVAKPEVVATEETSAPEASVSQEENEEAKPE